ncbi:MAG: hypothetical protein RR370_04345 [Synergistaceae bacterium]
MRYRKKPVVIEAFQYNGNLLSCSAEDYVPDWVVKAYQIGTLYYVYTPYYPSELFAKTLEGDHHVSIGDYVIQGVKGEIYPCKPDIFEMTYDLE